MEPSSDGDVLKMTFEKLESKWWFWTILTVMIIGLFGMIMTGSFGGFIASFVWIPLGIIMFLGIFGLDKFIPGWLMIVMYISWYATIIFFIFKIVKTKGITWKFIIALMLLLMLTIGGCVAGVSNGVGF